MKDKGTDEYKDIEQKQEVRNKARKQVISMEHKQQTFNLAELLTDRVELILGCRSETRM